MAATNEYHLMILEYLTFLAEDALSQVVADASEQERTFVAFGLILGTLI